MYVYFNENLFFFAKKKVIKSHIRIIKHLKIKVILNFF